MKHSQEELLVSAKYVLRACKSTNPRYPLFIAMMQVYTGFSEEEIIRRIQLIAAGKIEEAKK